MNKAILLGYVGAAPKLEMNSDGLMICCFPLCTIEEWQDRKTNLQITRHDWHSIISYGKLAKATYAHLHPGDNVLIEGVVRPVQNSSSTIEAHILKTLGHNSPEVLASITSIPEPLFRIPLQPELQKPSHLSIDSFKNKSSYIQLFSGTRQPANGFEIHLLKSIDGITKPLTPFEHSLVLFWNAWKIKQEFKSKNLRRKKDLRLHNECEDCGGEIPKDRLDAGVNATRCISCQTKHEQVSDPRVRASGGWHGLHKPSSSYKDQDGEIFKDQKDPRARGG